MIIKTNVQAGSNRTVCEKKEFDNQWVLNMKILSFYWRDISPIKCHSYFTSKPASTEKNILKIKHKINSSPIQKHRQV